MKVLEGDYREWSVAAPATVLTIGVYDGIHLGHQGVLAELQARAQGRPVAVVTFDGHPLTLSAPEHAPQLITNRDQKLELLDELGVDIVGFLRFDADLRQMAPEVFIERILVGTFHAGLVVVGGDFRFGYERAGDVDLLTREGPSHGFEVDSLDLIGKGAPFSSTAVRQVLHAGDVVTAAELLGRPFALRGTVIAGDDRGGTLGMPTANLSLPPAQVLPRHGVYAAMVTSVHGRFPGVVRVGVRPTPRSHREVVEVHLIGMTGDLVRTQLTVEFHDRIRDEERFDGVDEIVAQFERDVIEAGELLSGWM